MTSPKLFVWDKEDVRASFCWLLPVRNAIGHSRPLRRADVLTLRSAAARLFAATSVQVAKHGGRDLLRWHLPSNLSTAET